MAVDFGREMSCTTSLKTGRYVTGARLVAEAAYRRITTPRGMLTGGPEEDNYGIDLLDLIGSVSSSALRASVPGRIRNELTKDERIATVDVDVTWSTNGPSTTAIITIEAKTAAGPFSLKLSVNEVSVSLLNLEGENS